ILTSSLAVHYIVLCSSLFFFNDTATTEIYTLSLHDALPICSPRCPAWGSTTSRCCGRRSCGSPAPTGTAACCPRTRTTTSPGTRSEEHTSELQSRENLVCRLLLEKKKTSATTKTRTFAQCRI